MISVMMGLISGLIINLSVFKKKKKRPRLGEKGREKFQKQNRHTPVPYPVIK
jgi:hypothetical protein